MSKYAEFFREVAGWETIETPEFFVTYLVSDVKGIKSLKIVNAFVAKEFRSLGKSYEILDLMEEKAKELGCSKLSANLAKDATAFTQERTTHILRSRGMEKVYEDEYNIVFSRRL